MKVYPNPTESDIQIDLPENALVKIYNLVGIELASFSLIKGVNYISLSQLSTGVYIVEINSSSIKYSNRFKLIKK